jgi:predicted nucleic acid-binding protein
MRVFFDTSAFVKRYIEEPGSDRALEICGDAEHLVVSIICLPEMISTLSRLVREGKLSGDQYREIKDLIFDDYDDIEVCDITGEVIRQTIRCLENNPLRAMDGLHLGCALAVSPDLFVSSDRRQIEAARREGLVVEILE